MMQKIIKMIIKASKNSEKKYYQKFKYKKKIYEEV